MPRMQGAPSDLLEKLHKSETFGGAQRVSLASLKWHPAGAQQEGSLPLPQGVGSELPLLFSNSK